MKASAVVAKPGDVLMFETVKAGDIVKQEWLGEGLRVHLKDDLRVHLSSGRHVASYYGFEFNQMNVILVERPEPSAERKQKADGRIARPVRAVVHAGDDAGSR